MTMRTSLQHAFTDWYVLKIQRADRVWSTPEYRETGVKLHLRDFEPHLGVRIERTGINIVIAFDDRSWDVLYASDVTIHEDWRGFYSGSHQGEDEPRFLVMEQFWEHHLFEPLLGWVEKLRTYRALHLCEAKGWNWGMLSAGQSPAPEAALYTI